MHPERATLGHEPRQGVDQLAEIHSLEGGREARIAVKKHEQSRKRLGAGARRYSRA